MPLSNISDTSPSSVEINSPSSTYVSPSPSNISDTSPSPVETNSPSSTFVSPSPMIDYSPSPVETNSPSSLIVRSPSPVIIKDHSIIPTIALVLFFICLCIWFVFRKHINLIKQQYDVREYRHIDDDPPKREIALVESNEQQNSKEEQNINDQFKEGQFTEKEIEDMI